MTHIRQSLFQSGEQAEFGDVREAAPPRQARVGTPTDVFELRRRLPVRQPFFQDLEILRVQSHFDRLVGCQPLECLLNKPFDGECVFFQLLLKDLRRHQHGQFHGRLLQFLQIAPPTMLQLLQHSQHLFQQLVNDRLIGGHVGRPRFLRCCRLRDER